MIRWAVVIIASLSWVFAFRQYVSADRASQWALVGLAVVLGACDRRAWLPGAAKRRVAWLAVPAVAASLLAEPPYRPGLMLLAGGAVACALTSRSRLLAMLKSAGSSALFVGTVLVAQAPTYWLYSAWTARRPDVPFAASVLSWLLNWIKADASCDGCTVFLRLMREVHAITPTWDHLAVFPLLQVWFAGILLIVLAPNRERSAGADKRQLPVQPASPTGACDTSSGQRLAGAWGKLTATLIGYALIRFFLVILIFQTAMTFVEYGSDAVHVELFWLPWITCATFVPLVFILPRLVPQPSSDLLACTTSQGASNERLAPPGARECAAANGPTGALQHPANPPVAAAAATPGSASRCRGVAAAICTCVAGLALSIATAYYDPGEPKAGRVLLDEAHSEWERTDRAYDTDWYGQQSGYNYACIAEYIRRFYALECHATGPLTPEKLAGFDVLILKTPTQPFEPEEVRAIEAFVRRGGGLFAIGEHTNVFGSSTFLNRVLRLFGLPLRYDAVFDIERKWEQVYFPPSRAAHPIVQNMPFLRFAVSCSVQADSWRARPVIRSAGLWSLPIDYASGNFYPHVKDAANARFGCFDQMVARTAGAGRVAVFSDSTQFSNFLAFEPGKPQLLLGTLDWLNRRNRLDWINTAGWIVFTLASVAAGVLILRLRPSLTWAAAAASVTAMTTWLTLAGCTALSRQTYPPPQPRSPLRQVVFDMRHSSCELPLFGFTQDHANSYAIFYQWALRLGLFPSVAFDLDGPLPPSDALAIIKPTKPLTAAEARTIRAFLERGGALLVLDSADNADSTANELLAPYDMSLGCAALGRAVMEPASGAKICSLRGARVVQGGTPLLTSERGEPVAAYATVGRGRLIVGGLADRFADSQMGASSHAVPDLPLRAVYELQFALLRGLMDGEIEQQMHRLGRTYAR